MKKLGIGLLMALSVLFAATVNASAAPEEAKAKQAGPFQGTFHGTIRGDKGTTAPISLQLSQKGSQVEGTVSLGSGLYVDGGMCGGGYVPAGSQSAIGQTSAKDPKHVDTKSTFTVSGFKVTVDLDGDLSTNGKTLTSKAKIDLPWLCGRDPVISGTLYRAG